MNWAQTVNTLIFVLGTFFSVLEAIYLSRVWSQKLPDHIRPALEQFARMAVWQVEQENREASSAAKKQLAIVSVHQLFADAKLPTPPAKSVSIAIEAAVYQLAKTIVVESDNPPKIRSPKPRA